MLKIGHRGAPRAFPENTLSAFREALRVGADGIELDVHLSHDGQVAVIHDETLERTTNGAGKVDAWGFEALCKLRVGQGEHIPSLPEVFDVLGRDCHYYIEIKAPQAALPVAQRVQERISEGWLARKLCIISFHHEALREVKTAYPSLVVGASFETLTEHSVAQAKALGAEAMLPHYKALQRGHIEAAHEAGLQVVAWTVNGEMAIKAMYALGVDGIISDYPERL